MAGDVEAVNGLLMEHFPELVVSKGGKRPDLDVYFYVNCMQFIELIRCKSLMSSQLVLIVPALE